jgi:hypothetical protein
LISPFFYPLTWSYGRWSQGPHGSDRVPAWFNIPVPASPGIHQHSAAPHPAQRVQVAAANGRGGMAAPVRHTRIYTGSTRPIRGADFLRDSLTKICYALISTGTVGKLKNFRHLFYSIHFLKYRRFHVEFSIIRCSAVFFF